MARIVIVISGKGVRETTVAKMVEKFKADLGEAVSVSVKNEKLPSSRGERYSAAQSKVDDGKCEAEELRDELQERMDNMPENLQGGNKYSELEEAVTNLDEFIENCETAVSVDVSFPGMF